MHACVRVHATVFVCVCARARVVLPSPHALTQTHGVNSEAANNNYIYHLPTAVRRNTFAVTMLQTNQHTTELCRQNRKARTLEHGIYIKSIPQSTTYSHTVVSHSTKTRQYQQTDLQSTDCNVRYKVHIPEHQHRVTPWRVTQQKPVSISKQHRN